jgi:hypothetical protein
MPYSYLKPVTQAMLRRERSAAATPTVTQASLSAPAFACGIRDAEAAGSRVAAALPQTGAISVLKWDCTINDDHCSVSISQHRGPGAQYSDSLATLTKWARRSCHAHRATAGASNEASARF